MKPVKKILALILAGVMALAMLTGCGKATSPDRAVAESVVDWLKYACSQEGNKNEISVSYQIPELRRDIVPLFDTNWMSTTDDDELDGDAVISGTTTVTQALQQRLSNYNKDTSCTVFYATDVTDCAGFVSVEMFQLLTQSGGGVVVSGDYDTAPKNATHLRIAAAHKTIGEKTFLLAVVILRLDSPCPGALRPGAFCARPEQKSIPCSLSGHCRPGPAGDALVLQKMRLTSALRRGLRW